jgi:predicted enzyme related to lactoylglutathione lyase
MSLRRTRGLVLRTFETEEHEMTEITTHAPGTPCWVDLGTPDQDKAGAFYGGLFGWELQEDENAEATGGYRTAQLRGRAVGGVMKLVMEGQPPAWLTYIAVEDADATVAKAREAGAVIHAEPMSVLDYGRMAVLADPTGAAFGIWQAGKNPGFGVMKETGSVNWSELNTRDPEAAKAFYGSVFGWKFEDSEFEGTGTYTAISLGDGAFGGILDITDRVPAEVPAHWLVYFTVDDAEATAAKSKETGGDVVFGPSKISEVGTIAVLKDPFGAVFAVLQPDPAMESNA